MFETIVSPRPRARARWRTTAVSAALHLTALAALVMSTLYVTDTLPEPRESITMVFAAPAPPPPPPPPAPQPVQPAAAAPVKSVRAQVARPAVISRAPVAAPVEAPATIAPETGLEGGEFAPAGIEPGFEHGLPGGVIGGIVGGFDAAVPPPPPPARTEPVRVGGAITTPRLIKRVEPEYPAIAAAAQIEGLVILEATVDHTGVVRDAKVLRSQPLLDAAAIRAVEQWRYEPLMLNGAPSPFVLTVTLSFNIAAR